MRRLSRLKVAVSVLLILGVITTVRGQMDGTASGTPDPTARILWAMVPFALVTLAMVRLTGARAYEAALTAVAVFLWGSSTLYTNDEMRLSYWVTPVFQTAVVALAILVLTLHRWWVRKFRGTARS